MVGVLTQGLANVKGHWAQRLFEIDFIDSGLPMDEWATPEFLWWREEWSSPFIPKPILQPDVVYPSAHTSLRDLTFEGHLERIIGLEGELDDARAELETLHAKRASQSDAYSLQQSM